MARWATALVEYSRVMDSLAATPGEPASVPKPKGRGKRSRNQPHPTAVALLETAVELLDTVSIDQLTIAMVLERSGVSYGSLYHFYADISDLVEQAVVHRYTRRLRESLAAVRTLLDASDGAEFTDRAESLIRESLSPELRANRLERIEALGAMHGRPRLAVLISRAQQEITDAQAAMFREMQQRGWLRADLDAGVLSAFVQATLLGQVVNDIAEHPVDQGAWSEVGIQALRSVLFPN